MFTIEDIIRVTFGLFILGTLAYFVRELFKDGVGAVEQDYDADYAFEVTPPEPWPRTEEVLTEFNQPGRKADADKPRIDLVLLDFGSVLPEDALTRWPRAMLELGKVAAFGAKKYTEHGWRTVPDGVKRYGVAAQRHFAWRMAGEFYDIDSGLPHYVHETWNNLAVKELIANASGHVLPTEDELTLLEDYLREQTHG